MAEVALEMEGAELSALDGIATEMDMSRSAVMRQALRLYQLVRVRAAAGETFGFSGDAQRAREFAAPPEGPRSGA